MTVQLVSLNGVVDRWPEPMLLLDHARFLDANAAALELLGYADLGELQGRHPTELSPATQSDGRRSLPAAEEILRRAHAGEPLRFTWTHLKKDGSPFTVDVSLAPIPVEARFLLLCAWHDQTERLQEQQELIESEARFRGFFERNASVMLVVDPESAAIVDANAAAVAFYGWSRAELVQMRITEINQLSPEEVAAARARAAREEQNHFEFVHGLASGELRDVEVHSTPIHQGGRLLLLSIIHDITLRKRAEAELRLAAAVFEHSREGIVVTDAQATIVKVNRAFPGLTGYSAEEMLGKNPRVLASGRHDRAFYEAMWATLRREGRWAGELRNRRKDGELYAELLSVSAVPDAQGAPAYYVGLFTDITVQKHHEAQLERLAHHDALTGLPSRRLLLDRLQQALLHARRSGHPVAVVYLDLDGFKAVNDVHGHGVGDQLLTLIAHRFRGCLREGDTIARLGGDEFVAVLVDLPEVDAARPVLERLLAAASLPVEVEGRGLQVGASLGVSVFPQHDAVDADQLLRQADHAMYQAKLSGKGRFHFFDVDHDRSVRAQLENLGRIGRALENDEFHLWYQPQVNLRTGAVVGVEALVRWAHPERGLLLPGAFLPAIEGDPLVCRLTDRVLERALRQQRAWREAGLDLPVSVNIASRDLQDPAFPMRLGEALARHPDVPHGRLSLEVLETRAIEDPSQAAAAIRACRQLGVGFALDDFGTGYCTLAYLKSLPVQRLKIDRTFVRDMLEDADDLAILEGVLGLAGAFRLEAMAEGVESTEHARVLLSLGCELGQGFGIARPMPGAEVAGWVAGWRPDPAWKRAARPA